MEHYYYFKLNVMIVINMKDYLFQYLKKNLFKLKI